MCVKKYTQISENAGKFYTQRLETSSLSACIDKQHKDGVQCWQESPKLFTLLSCERIPYVFSINAGSTQSNLK